ncbi:tetratricopeptide repeat protein [Azospirillum halopraeferens]|uniref:tetratricopeptide repeat protein n=1 Tax=Azospirillum halopraeferens TaxID=34010 RepID=UPI0003FD6B13|nr:hypothetical protein [Azospirillum halopraeferens]
MTRPLFPALIPAAAAALLAAAFPSQAAAQATPRALAPGVEVEVDSPGAPVPGRIDETALRYYARIGDVARLEAEIARLKAIDPLWDPPADLFAPQAQPSGVDETPFWERLSAGRIAEARAAIAEQRVRTPGWQPSARLLEELDLAEATRRVRDASEANRWSEVVEAAAAEPRVLTCARLDTLWRTAEAYGRLGRTEDAFALYRTAVTTCPRAAERRDTLFKASAHLPPERVRDLAELGATANPAEGEDYAAVRGALAELEVGRTLARLGARGAEPAAADLARAEAAVLERRDADGALALGWFHQNRRRFAQALEWFGRANEWEPGERAAEGLVLAYAGLNRRAEALEAARPWRGTSRRVDQAVRAVERPAGTGGPAAPRGPSPLDRALAARDWSGCLDLIEAERRANRFTAALAQQRGWCLMELDRPTEAEAAFAQALALAPSAPPAERRRLTEGAEYGALQARLRQDDATGVVRDLPTSQLSEAQRRDLRAGALASQALRAYEEQRHRDALRLLDARRELEAEPRGLTLMRGWSLYALGRQNEALAVFEALDRRLSTADTREAVSVARRAIYRGE